MIRRLLARHRYMREHRFAHAHLSDYLDEELSPRRVARVEQHVGVCPQCRQVVATLRRTLAGLRSLAPASDPGVADGVIERLRSEP